VSNGAWAYGPKEGKDRRRKWSRSRKALAGAVGMMLAGAVAFAIWTHVIPNADGETTIGSALPIFSMSVTPAEATETVFPGGTAGATFKIDNQAGGPVHIIAVQGTAASVVGSQGACDSGNVDFPAWTGDVTVPSGVNLVTVPDVVTLLGSAPDGCKGGSIDGVYSVTFTT
jgi:hypothetical protein